MSLEETISQELGYVGAKVIGAGAVSEALIAQLDGQPVIIKVLGRQHSRTSLEAQGLANEPKVLRRLNEAEDPAYRNLPDAHSRLAWAQRTAQQRTIVALLDNGETASLGTWVVQEFAPDEFRPGPVTGLAGELPILQVMRRVAQAMALAHKNDYALCDFEPQTKGDRIRVRWHEGSDEPEVRLIDWNVTKGPEDFPKDLFYFGGHLYRLLLGELVPLDGDGAPPHTLGLGVERWKLLSEGTRLLLSRLLHRDPARRYRSAQELADDLDWHVRSVEIALRPNPIEKIRERANMALTQGRYDRLLAITSLGLSLDLPQDIRQMLGKLNEDARNELEKELRVALAMISVSITSRNYRQAIAEAHQELRHLDERGELARRVRYLELQAKVGQAFRSTGQGDVSEASAWAAIERGMKYVGRTWEDADREFHQAEALAPRLRTLADWPALRDLPEAWLSFERAAKFRAEAQPGLNAEKAEAWGQREEERLELLGQAVAACERATQLAANELAFHDGLAAYRRELERRKTLLAQLNAADEALATGQDSRALELLQGVLQTAPTNARAAYLLPIAERRTRFLAALKTGSAAVAAGDYREAQRRLDEVKETDPENETWRTLHSLAVTGAAIAVRLEELLDTATSAKDDELAAAWLKVEKAKEANGAQLAALGRDLGVFEASTLLNVHESKFQASDALKERIAQTRQAITAATKARNKETLDDIEQLWQAGNFSKAVELAENTLRTTPQPSPPIDPDGVERLTGWLGRLSAGHGDALARAIGLLEGAKFLTGRDEVRNQLAGVLATLNAAWGAKVNGQLVLPDSLRGDVAAIRDTMSETLKPDGQPVAMPTLLSPAWAALVPHSNVREILTERAATYVSANAQAAQARGDYAEAERGWARLEKLRGRLEDTEKQARQAGEKRLQDLAQVKIRLESAASLVATTPPQCAEAHKLLLEAADILAKVGQIPGAAELSLRMGELWLKTIQTTSSPQEGLTYAERAQALLHDAQWARRLEPAIELLQTGVQADADEKRLPKLMQANEGAKIDILLADQHMRLAQLQGAPDSWKQLGQWAKTRQDAMIGALIDWLNGLQQKVEMARSQGDYRQAALLAGQANPGVWAARWRDPLQAEITALTAAGSQAQEIVAAHAALATARDKLHGNETLLAAHEGQALIEGLQEPPQADPEWNQGIQLLRQGHKLAEILTEVPPQKTGFANAIDKRLALSHELITAAPSADWVAWHDWLQELKTRVAQTATGCAGPLAMALRDEADALPQSEALHTTRLLELYWEARWARAALRGQAQEVASLEDALAAAGGILSAVANGPFVPLLVALGTDETNSEKWATVRTLVAQLSQWRLGLTGCPSTKRLPETPVKDDYVPALSCSIEELDNLATELKHDRQPRQRRNALEAFLCRFSDAYTVATPPALPAATPTDVQNALSPTALDVVQTEGASLRGAGLAMKQSLTAQEVASQKIPAALAPQASAGVTSYPKSETHPVVASQPEAASPEMHATPPAASEAEKGQPQSTSGGWWTRLRWFKPAQPKPDHQPIPRAMRPTPAHTSRPEPSGETNDGDK